MLLQKKKYKIDGIGTQHIIKVLGYLILIGVSENDFYIKFGKKEYGVHVTKKPNFSVRNGFKKSLKLGKYYINKIK
jgi:hypothetical protein